MSRVERWAQTLYRGWTTLRATRGRTLPQGPPLPGSHSHNDNQQLHPLVTALRHGFVSVEADTWSVDGELLVGHDAGELRPDNTLRRVYLEPLVALIATAGSVYPNYTAPFRLLIDVKNDPATTYALLETILAEYGEFVTRYDGDTVVPGPLSVVVTGEYPRQAVAARTSRLVACDGRLSDLADGPSLSLVPSCSEPWRAHFGWRGLGPMPAAEREKLHRTVTEVQSSGRTMRFWGAATWPAHARRAAWNELVSAGVDYIGVDHLSDYRRWRERLGRATTPTV